MGKPIESLNDKHLCSHCGQFNAIDICQYHMHRATYCQYCEIYHVDCSKQDWA